MRTKNRILGLLLAAVMCLSLAACGKMPTAEELIKNGMPEGQSVDADLILMVDGAISIEELGITGLGLSMSINANLQTMGDVRHMTGEVNVKAFGQDETEKMDEWSVTDGDETITYTYDADSETWTYRTAYEDSEGLAGITDLGPDVFKDLAVEKDKKSGDYVVTGKVDMAALEESGLSDVMDEMISMGSNDTPELDVSVRMVYDGKTRQLKTLEMNVDVDADGVEFDTFSIVLNINSIGKIKELKVPDEVLAAEPEYVYDWSDHDWELDGDWSYDDSDWEYDDEDWDFDFGGFDDDAGYDFEIQTDSSAGD